MPMLCMNVKKREGRKLTKSGKLLLGEIHVIEGAKQGMKLLLTNIRISYSLCPGNRILLGYIYGCVLSYGGVSQ